MAVRLVAMLWWFLLGELYGLLGLFAIWIASGGRDSRAPPRPRVSASSAAGLRSHLGGIRVLFGLRFEFEGLELAGPGPVLVMTRHASIIDNTLPDVIDRRRARHRLPLRDQARAADAADDRHRRSLGADAVRAPRLGRHRRASSSGFAR